MKTKELFELRDNALKSGGFAGPFISEKKLLQQTTPINFIQTYIATQLQNCGV